MKQFARLWSVVNAMCIVALTTQEGLTQVPPDTKEVQGKWVLSSLQVDGKEVPQSGNPLQLSFAGTKCFFGSTEGGFALRNIRELKEMDLSFSGQGGTAFILRGIYERNADTLTLCLPGMNGKRPSELRTVAGDGRRLYRFKLVHGTESGSPGKNREVPGQLTGRGPLRQLLLPGGGRKANPALAPVPMIKQGGIEKTSQSTQGVIATRTPLGPGTRLPSTALNGFATRADFGPDRGTFNLSIIDPDIHPTSHIFASVSERDSFNNRFIGDAIFTVHSIAPREGVVTIGLTINWSTAIPYAVDLLVIQP